MNWLIGSFFTPSKAPTTRATKFRLLAYCNSKRSSNSRFRFSSSALGRNGHRRVSRRPQSFAMAATARLDGTRPERAIALKLLIIDSQQHDKCSAAGSNIGQSDYPIKFASRLRICTGQTRACVTENASAQTQDPIFVSIALGQMIGLSRKRYYH